LRIFARHILFLTTGHFRIFFLLFPSAVIFLPFPVLYKAFQLLHAHLKNNSNHYLFISNAASKTLGVCFSSQEGEEICQITQVKKIRGKIAQPKFKMLVTLNLVLCTLSNVRARKAVSETTNR
jgi:hypothetical protein